MQKHGARINLPIVDCYDNLTYLKFAHELRKRTMAKSRTFNPRRINLLDLWQRQNDLAPISRHVVQLTRITLKIDRFEVFKRCELRVESSERRDLVVTRLKRCKV